jgi:hypothetical protein
MEFAIHDPNTLATSEMLVQSSECRAYRPTGRSIYCSYKLGRMSDGLPRQPVDAGVRSLQGRRWIKFIDKPF